MLFQRYSHGAVGELGHGEFMKRNVTWTVTISDMIQTLTESNGKVATHVLRESLLRFILSNNLYILNIGIYKYRWLEGMLTMVNSCYVLDEPWFSDHNYIIFSFEENIIN